MMDRLLSFVLVLVYISCTFALYEVTNLACNPASSTSLEFTWSRPNDPSRNVIGYKLNLQRSDNLVVDVVPEQTVNDYYTETYTYGGLGKYGIYTFTLNTYTASGNEPTQTLICRTLTDVPAQAPATVEAVGISYSEITVDWSEIDQKDRCGVLLGYKIIYYQYISSWPTEITVDNSTFQHTITGLEFDTYYLVGVKGYTSVGDGPVTTDSNKTLGLPTNPPEVVTKYYCYEAIPGLITISWDGMPCTIYVGAIGFLFIFCCIFGVGCCIACCSKKPPEPEADMPGGGRGGHSNGRSYDTDSYYSNEYDDKPYKKSIGDVTARDIHISTPGPSDYEDTPRKPSIMPKVGKNLMEDNKAREAEHGESDNGSRKEDDNDSVYFSDESPPGTPKTKRSANMDALTLADLEEMTDDENQDSRSHNSDDDGESNNNENDETQNGSKDDEKSNDNEDDGTQNDDRDNAMSNDSDDKDGDNKSSDNLGEENQSHDGEEDEIRSNDNRNDENESDNSRNDDNVSNDSRETDDISNDSNDEYVEDNDDRSGVSDRSEDEGSQHTENDQQEDDASNDNVASNEDAASNDDVASNDTRDKDNSKDDSAANNISDSDTSDDDDIPILFGPKASRPAVINVKPSNNDAAETEKSEKNIFDIKDEKPPEMTPGHFKLDNMFLCKIRKQPKLKQVASDVMLMNKVTQGMKPNNSKLFRPPSRNSIAPSIGEEDNDGIPKSRSVPEFNSMQDRPGNGGSRSNEKITRQFSTGEEGLGGEQFFKMDSMFLVGVNKRNKNVKKNLNKDYLFD